jgi:hypothetical protein
MNKQTRTYRAGILLLLLAVTLCCAGARAVVYNEPHDTLQKMVGFPAWGYDTDWRGFDLSFVGAYVRLYVSAGGTVIDVRLDGAGNLVYPVAFQEGDFGFNGGPGAVDQDVGIELSGRYRITIDLWGIGGDYEGDLPYVPNTDIRLQDSESFTSYNLGNSVTLVDTIQNQELYVLPIGIDGVFTGNIGVSITAGNEFTVEFKRLETDSFSFTADGERTPVSVPGTDLVIGGIQEVIGLDPAMTILPNVVVGVTVIGIDFNFDIPTITIPISLTNLLEPEYVTAPPRTIQFLIPPVLYSMSVNYGAQSTLSRTVTLTPFTSNSPAQYMASINPAFPGAVWETWTPEPVFTLGDFDGTQTVYFKTRNANGESGVISDAIKLNRTRPTVDTLVTRDTSPELTGTAGEPEWLVTVTVDGQTFSGINHGTGYWNLPGNTLLPLDDGVYDVQVTAADSMNNTLSDSTTGELTLDATPPAVTVDESVTSETLPEITGTVDDPAASVVITTEGQTENAINNGDGTWTVPANLIVLSEGRHDVTAVATDTFGNSASDTTYNEIRIDTTDPVVTVDSLRTPDQTPELTGMIDEPDATVSVTVSAVAYGAVNNGDGTWTLPDDTIAGLSQGIYDVVALATDAAGNTGLDGTLDELEIDWTPPIVTVNALVTSDPTPMLSGNVDDPGATVIITVDGQMHTAVNTGGGIWYLPNNALAPLEENAYDVQAVATDPAGNSGQDNTTGELTIDFSVPLITVDTLYTADTTPALTGTVYTPGGTVAVTVAGQTFTAQRSGNDWNLPDDTLSPLDDGLYDVQVSVTDGPETWHDNTTGELQIDTQPPETVITRTGTTPTGNETVSWRVAFSEPVAGSFDETDITLTGSLATQADFTLDGADQIWTVEVTISDEDADGDIGIATGTAITDQAGLSAVPVSAPRYNIENWCGFSQQPQAARRYAGASITFTAEAGCGGGSLLYQWKRDNGSKAIENVGDPSPTLGIPIIVLGHAGLYWCEVTYDGVTYSSDAALLEVARPVTITAQPEDAVIIEGETATLEIEAEGGFGALMYNWLHEGVPAGFDNPVLEIEGVTEDDAGNWVCAVIDDNLTEPVYSEDARIIVNSALSAGGIAGLAILVLICGLAMLLLTRRRRTADNR